MKKILKNCKRAITFLLVICIVISNSNITATEVLAEEPEKNQYTVVCKIKETNKEISDSEVKIVIFDGDNEIKKTDNAYELEKGKEYNYKITSESPKFEGSTLEIREAFTAGTDREIPIFIPLDKLNIEMGNKECYKDGSISMFAADDWNLDWEWTSDNDNVAKVDNQGNVTGIGEGTATITKVSGVNSKITASAQVTVSIRKVNCKLNFEIIKDEQSGEKEALSEKLELVTIKDKNGKEIRPEENGNYSLIPEEPYEIQIKDTGIKEAKESFDAPAYRNDGEENIPIPLKLVEPEITINGKSIKDIKKMKMGSTITLQCTNYASLYQKGNWEFKINGENQDLSEGKECKIEGKDASDKFQIDYKCKKDEFTNYIEKNNSILIFDQYEFITKYDEYKVAPSDLEFTIRDSNDNNIDKEAMVADSTYSITVAATGFEESEVNKVTTEFDEQEIPVTLGKIIPPELKAVKGYCGEKISLSEVVEGSYCDSWENWNWKCVKEDDPNKILVVDKEKNEIDLNTAETGTYKLTCSYKDVERSAIITVNKIHLWVDWETWKKEKIEEPYTASKSLKVRVKMGAPYVKFINEEGVKKNSTESGDCIVITGELDKEDVASYDKLSKIQINIEGKKEKYDLSEIEKELEELGRTLQGLSIEIKQISGDVRFSEDKVFLGNRSHEIVYKNKMNLENISMKGSKTILNDISDEQKDMWLKKLCEELMGKPVEPIEQDEKYCTFNSGYIKYDKRTVYIENKNMKITLTNGYEFPNGELRFLYEYITEKLYLKDISRVFNIIQEQDSKEIFLQNGNFCNMNHIKAEFKENHQYKEFYNTIKFSELTDINNWNDLSESAIEQKVNGVQEEKINIALLDDEKEKYYTVVFSKQEENKEQEEHKTIAAIIRIMPEGNCDSGTNYETSYEVSDGNSYPVINLFFDNTPPEVTVTMPDSLDRTTEEFKQDVAFNINEIQFNVEDSGFGVDDESVQYCIRKFEKETELETFPLKEELKKPKKSEETYIVNKSDYPKEDGKYVLYVKTKDKGGNVKEYISNGFCVDHTNPNITATFTGFNGNERDAIKKGERVYKKEEIKVKITIDELHLDGDKLEVTIKAEDGKGNEIDSKELQNEIRDGLKDQQNIISEFTKDANYTITIKATDMVGLSDTKTYKFTVDTKKPEGSVSATGSYHKIKSDEGREKGKITLVAEKLKAVWDKLTEAIYKIFSQEEIKVTLTGNDTISPVDIYYYITAEKLNEEQLEEITNWTTYPSEESKKLKITMNQQKIVYGKVVDKAGNTSYFCTAGMITDNEPPKVDSPVIGKAANKNGFYNSDIPFSVNIEDKIAEGGTASSGLQYVSYRIEKEGSIPKSEVKYDVKDKPVILEGVISAEKFNSNDVTLYVTAVDNAGNIEEKKKDFKIDTVKPEISVTYDGDSGTKYCNRVRTATITIKERNLDTKDVDISIKSNRGSKASIGTWSHSSDIGKSDDATYTCQVVFSEDDEYQFAVSCVDKAGNKAVNNFTDEFTIDTTKPVIAVNYNKEILSQDAYFNEPVTATITITERNFDAGKVNIQNNAGTSGGTIPGVTGFSSNGDTHTATIQYNTDGRYGLSIEYTDEAGNQADSYTGNNFTVDLTEPEIKITNIENRSANKDKVQPVITCTDANYDVEQVSVTVTGSNSGEVELKNLGYAVSNIADGQQFTMDFPKTEELDDVYTLTAKIKDKAGNEKESSIDFSVNRYGSVYTLATETGEWLKNNECAYIKEGKPIVILETNVDEITDQNISYMMGGMGASIVNIKESAECSPEEKENGSYFTASKVDTNGQWHQSKYEIHANNFTKEGRYTIQIDSTDRAGNHTSNVSNKHNGGNLQIEFAVDQTAPSVVVTGADSGDIYNEETHTVLLDVQDNLAMDYVTVYLNGKEYGTYKEEDIEKMENGFIPVNIKESISTQKIQVKAMDMAGNILGKDVNGAYDKSFDDFKILVTRNPFVRILHKTWLLLIILLIVLCGIGVFIVVKRKKKQD